MSDLYEYISKNCKLISIEGNIVTLGLDIDYTWHEFGCRKRKPKTRKFKRDDPRGN